jgi:hypothetical protein
MSVLYVVRSRFIDPVREEEWNEWYAGHLDVLLGVPGFLAAQRFHSDSTVDDRPYLAMYEVAGPEVFTSEPYLAIWGFDEWRPLIDNWTRDIFESRGRGLGFGTPRGEWLHAAFVSGPSAAVDEALAVLEAERPSLRSAAVCGLDRSCQAVAWEPAVGAADGPAGFDLPPVVQLAEAAYQPITDHLTEPARPPAVSP